MYRAGLLAAYGWPAAVDRMTRYSTWIAADAIHFSLQSDADRHVGDSGLQFVPVTRSSGTWLAEWPPEDFAVVYPARGIADTLTPRNEQALDRLMGSGRARILRELDQPATTTDLASQLGAALGTIGAHLAILRNAQLTPGPGADTASTTDEHASATNSSRQIDARRHRPIPGCRVNDRSRSDVRVPMSAHCRRL